MPDVLMDQFFAARHGRKRSTPVTRARFTTFPPRWTSCRAYQGPPEPVGGPAPEWGAAAAEMPDEAPLEGPALAPYGQAADEGD